jgi:hypothetical protein
VRTQGKATALLVIAGASVVALFSSRSSAHPTGTVKWSTVARVVAERCVACHDAAGHAQPPLDGYEHVRRAADAVKRVVLERRMPPWYAVEGFGDFADDPTLTPTEIGWVADWVDAGAPGDEQGDLMPTTQTTGSGARHAPEPDLVLRAPPYRIAEPSHTFAFPTRLDRDRWIRGWEITPGTPARIVGAVLSIAPDTTVATWSAGEGRTMLPDGVARRLPKSSTILLSINYQRVSAETIDESSVALFFGDAPQRPVTTMMLPCGTTRLPRRVEVLAARPAREPSGEGLMVLAHQPDGGVEPLGWFRNYPRPHLRTYWLRRPVVLPGGTSISVAAPVGQCGAELEYVSP